MTTPLRYWVRPAHLTRVDCFSCGTGLGPADTVWTVKCRCGKTTHYTPAHPWEEAYNDVEYNKREPLLAWRQPDGTWCVVLRTWLPPTPKGWKDLVAWAKEHGRLVGPYEVDVVGDGGRPYTQHEFATRGGMGLKDTFCAREVPAGALVLPDCPLAPVHARPESEAGMPGCACGLEGAKP